MKNRLHIYDIDLGLNMGTYILNMKFVLVKWWFFVSSYTWATFETQFMKKLSNIDAELKKSVGYKKSE